MKKTATFTFIVTAFFGCASAPTSEMSKVTDLPTLLTQAQEAITKADSVGGEWRDTQKIIKQAKAEAEKGQTEQAMKLARKALKQAQLGYQQSISQQNAKPWLF